jgi:DNA-binding response OmpR family regulator
VPKSLVIVEDDAQIRALLTHVLSNEGFDVVAAEDGAGALTRVRKRGGRFAAVLTDIDMGRMNGLELAQLVRAEFPAMPILFISGLPVPPTELAQLVPGSAFISKPFDGADLVKTIRKLIDLK